MRTLPILICCLFLYIGDLQAQNSPDCRTAIPVCADMPIMGLADGGGDIEDFDPEVITQTGCLEKGSVSSANIENNTSWYVFRAGTAGQVGFDIEAMPTNGGMGAPTAEWDFAVYGPYDETDGQTYCTIIGDGTSEPIRCNYEVNNTTFTGIGINPENAQEGAPFLIGSQNTYDEWLDVQSGELYFIFINNFNTNFDDDSEPFVLSFTGSSVQEDQNTALDCTLRDEFLGLDVVACEGDPDIVLSALRSPAGPDIGNVTWSVDYDDDGTPDQQLASGPTETELVVSSPNSGRYFVTITRASNPLSTVVDSGGVLITFYGDPILDRIEILDTNLSIDPNQNDVEFIMDGDSSYEFAINGGAFQDSSVFLNIPPGENTVIINDKNGCGITEPIPFIVFAYPKFFTPNGDGINDDWNIQGIDATSISNVVVFIFDRYGKLLKQLGVADTWDGTFNGSAMPSTDYWFKFEYSENDNVVPIVAKNRRTHFTLKR
ncbi:T9SS type B sorting domain-containing protein [Maribacter antarcticus]|uniref:T9SS type B sorting domain-containing protein n=1 Tax=Maribacter antarcticus TaxID=505250 RepID=UPI00047AEC26|nr:T9SS type B sorting domain-containing protein [Maribacter antarcticus]